MKKQVKLTLGSLLLSMVMVGCASTPNVEDTKNVEDIKQEIIVSEGKDFNLVVAHLNDTHGRVSEGKYDGMGLPRVSTMLKKLRAENQRVLFLDAGDTLHGTTFATLSKGESIVRILNYMQLDAMSAGNHDFNYGQDRLKELEKMAEFDIIAANIETEEGMNFLNPYVIKEMDGVKVGIFGLSTPETEYKTSPKNIEGLTFTDPATAARKTVAELERKGADFIIAVCHLGIDPSTKKQYQSIGVVESVDGIDLLVDGHSHTALTNGMVVNDTTIVQTGEYDKNFGIVDINVENGEKSISPRLVTKKEALGEKVEEVFVAEVTEKMAVEADYKIADGDTLSEISFDNKINMNEIAKINSINNLDLIYAGNTIKLPMIKEVTTKVEEVKKAQVGGVEKDPELLNLITSIKAEQDKITSVIIGENNTNLIGERGFVRTGETNLGNLITESVKYETGADIVVTNGGGIRASIPEGEVTVGDVITVLPFGNYIITKEVTGADIVAALEHGMQDYPATKGAFPHVAGIRVIFDAKKPAGERVTSVTMENGEPIDTEATYTLATNDFMAAGGDGYEMFADGPVVGNYAGLDEILIKYIKVKGTNVKVDGRVTPINK